MRTDGKVTTLAPAKLPLRLLDESGAEQALVLRLRGSVGGRSQIGRSVSRLAARQGDRLVFLQPREIWAFQASARLTFVHSEHGRFDLDCSLLELEASFCRPLTRVHRNWLVDLTQVRAFERASGGATLFVGSSIDERRGVRVPVSRDLAHDLRERLLSDATGVRHSAARDEP